MKTQNIAIIGGGITGLVAAYRLAKNGNRVTIFERSHDLGGLAGGFKIHGNNLEKAYHHLFNTDKEIIKFVKEIGIEDKLQWHESSMGLYNSGELYKFSTPLDLIKFPALSFVNRIRTGIVTLILQKTKNPDKFKKISASKWLKKWYGEEAYKVIWEPLLVGKFNNYHTDVSMAWFWARMYTRGNSREKTGKEMLGYFEGGFNSFIEALTEKLEDLNVDINTGVEINKIISNKDGSVELNLIDEYGKDILAPTIKYDKLIATIPSPVFAKLIKENDVSKNYLKQLSSIKYLGAIDLIFSSTQDISDYYWHNINDLDSPFLVFINHTKLINKSEYDGKYLYYIGGYYPHNHKYFSSDNSKIINKWLKGLKRIFPEFDEKKVIEKHVFKFKNAQHIVDTKYEDKIPKYSTPLKNIFLSNFSQIYPEDRGTNFAVREGGRIVELIENSIKTS